MTNARLAGELRALYRLVHSELLKAFSGFMLAGVAVIGAALVALAIFGTAKSDLDRAKVPTTALPAYSDELLRLGLGMLLFSTVFGILLVTSEYRHGTVTRTFLIARRRWDALAAKMAVAALVGLLLGILGDGAAALTAGAMLGTSGHHLQPDREGWLVMLGLLAANALAGAWGVAIGFIVRNQIVAVIAYLAYALVVEVTILRLFPPVGKWLPGGAQTAMYFDTKHYFSFPGGTLLFLGWLAGTCVVAVVLLKRRDVSSASG